MPEHLNHDQLKGYRDRTLPLGELVAVDAHLGRCEPCRSALSALADQSSSASVVSGIDQARFRHLSYEQMDDSVEDRLEPADRELVMAHIGLCPPCARQLIAYQEYAPVMAAPLKTSVFVAAQPVKQSFWSFLKQPQYALGAAALIAFFIVVPMTRHSSPEQTGAILAPANTAMESTIPANNSPLLDEALNATELDQLPDSLRAGAKEAISDTNKVVRPLSLKGLEGSSDPVLEYPLSEVVAETQLALHWKAFGDSTYTVSISDARGLISRRGGLKDRQWTPPGTLVRDRIYTWEVESGGQKHRGMFRVLGETQAAELEKVRGSHLVVGAVDEELGLLTPAKREFEALAKEKGQAPRASKLVSHIDELRK